MTTEEILSKHTGEKGIYLTHGQVRGSEALEAMDEYAKQESIGFAEWAALEGYSLNRPSKQWFKTNEMKFIPTEELYTLYLQSKNKK